MCVTSRVPTARKQNQKPDCSLWSLYNYLPRSTGKPQDMNHICCSRWHDALAGLQETGTAPTGIRLPWWPCWTQFFFFSQGPALGFSFPPRKASADPTTSLYPSRYSCCCIIALITIYNDLIDVYLFMMSLPLECKHICLSLCIPSTMLDT